MSAALGRKGSSFRWAMLALAAAGLAVCALPVLMIVAMSFSGGNPLEFPPRDLTLQWYGEAIDVLFSDAGEEDVMSAWGSLRTSLLVAGAVMASTVLACVPLAYVLARSRGRWRSALETLFAMPLVFPLVVLGLAFLLMAERFSGETGIELGIWRLIVPHVTLALPFVLRNCIAAMSGVHRELEEAALSLGATPRRAFLDVIVPLMKPGILAGLIFAFIISFNEFTATFFMYTVDMRTLPIWMYSRTVSALDPATLAISTFIILLDVVLIVWVDKLVAGRNSLF